MFEIDHVDDGTVRLRGRFDAAQVETAARVLRELMGSPVIDFRELTYISSAGLGLLFATHKRLVDAGGGLRLVNLNPHISEVFQIAGFHHIFSIGETPAGGG